MRNDIFTATLAALGLIGSFGPSAFAQNAPSSARQHPSFSVDATVSQVDIDRDRVVVKGDDGRAYTVDTYRTHITLRDTNRAGETADLVPGMRVHIAGSLLSQDIIEPTKVVVLPSQSVRSARPAADSSRSVFNQDRRISLRGTVESVNNQRGSFVVQVNNHTRTVFLDDRTKLDDFNNANTDQLPFQAGDRVSVVGKLAQDGTVDASLISPRILDDQAGIADSPVQHSRTLLGRVADSSGMFSRDIKIRLAVAHVVTVHVPKGIPITRNGHAISVHDLQDDQVIRVTGDYNGDSFNADRIALLPDSAGKDLNF